MTSAFHGLEKVVETDVLVLGAGVAGCAAAMAARKEGAKVLLVEKGKLESAGAAGGGNDHFMANLNTGPAWDSDETVINFLSKAPNGLTADFIKRKWLNVIPIILRFLEDAGVEFVKNPDGTYFRTTGFGQPGPLWLNIENGEFIKRHIAQAIRALDITVLDHLMITKLLCNGNHIAGSVGFNVLDGTFYILRAKKIVLALGGPVARATNNSTGNPYNCQRYPYNTGSNHILAYDAGATLANLEIGDHATLIPKGFGCPGMNGLNSMGGHELNSLGERFMGKYSPHWENCPRKVQVAATYQEMIEGKGPPFFMDMRHLSKEDVDYLQNVLMVGDKATFNDYLGQKGESLATHPLEVEISEITLGGRIVTNDGCESSIDGLFSACGFPFLSGSLCGGFSAGLEAGKAALKVRNLSKIDVDEADAEKQRIFNPMATHGKMTPNEFEKAIRQVMDYYMGHVRNQRGMEIAIEKLILIEGYTNEIRAANYHELMRFQEAIHLLKHCQLTTKASIERKESGRTLYRRSDYPDINDELDKCLLLWQEKGMMKVAFGPPL